MSERLQFIRTYLRENKLDGLLVSKPESRRYLSGFTGSAAQLLITPDHNWLFTDFRYVNQAAAEAPDFKIFQYSNVTGTMHMVMSDAIKSVYGTKELHIGFEGDFVVHDALEGFKSALPALNFKSISLRAIRSIKDAQELPLMRKAMEIAEKAYLEIMPLIRPGISEAALAAELEISMRRHGADDRAFESIVASGERSSLPHGHATDKLLAAGDFVTLDFGALYKGYRSDMTRTVCLGPATAKQKEVYELVLKAHLSALEAIRPGALCRDVDGTARKIITEGGYGENFGHGLGHGLGLEVHEEPFMSTVTRATLSVGTVVTVEPGIYLPGWGGVRIEDTVVVTPEGFESFNKTSKQLLELE